MTEIVYNSIGTSYNTHRAADIRIINTIKKLLDLQIGSTIADIGAGTGNYSNAFADLGYKVKAVEPSDKMRNQAKPNRNVTWLHGTAESIPLPDNSVNGIIIVLALHHFSSLERATSEMHRICPTGPIVVFTLDPREGEESWFKDYFPEIYQKDFTSFQPIARVSEMIATNGNWSTKMEDFPLPYDLSDKNMYSAWREPERYLNAQFRRNTSGFALAAKSSTRDGIERLKKDLDTGIWDKKHGFLRKQKYFDAGFKFIKCKLR